MGFCKFSTEYVANNTTTIDNIFISEYLPSAPDNFLKVYIYGLAKCNNSSSFDNTLEHFSNVLKMPEKEIEEAFLYWEDLGLVQVLQTSPIEIRYLPVKNAINSIKFYVPKKFEDFNIKAQEIIEGRAITPFEFSQYYDFMDMYKVQKEALLMIIQYCVNYKNKSIGYNYILTVAKSWAREGITSMEQVEEKICTFEEINSFLGEILKAMGKKRNAYIEEKELYNKWINKMGFEEDLILSLVQNKKLKIKSMEYLDEILSKYYEMKLFSIAEINIYEDNKAEMLSIAKQINRKIGVYYENLENIVDTYITKWLNLGYEANTLYFIADYAFKSSVRTLEGLDRLIDKFYKLGIIRRESLEEYFGEILEKDKIIKDILMLLGMSRNVNSFDRDKFKIWTEDWKISDELIRYGAELSKDKNQPIQYLSKVLSVWHENDIKTPEQAKQTNLNIDERLPKENFTGRSYSKEEINSLYQSIDEIEV